MTVLPPDYVKSLQSLYKSNILLFMTLIITPTHPDANSYATVEEADDYFVGHSNESSWAALTADQKEKALKSATRAINTYRFFSEPVYEYPTDYRDKQALKFPRKCGRQQSGKPQTIGADYFIDANLANRQDTPDNYWRYGVVVINFGTGKGKTYDVTAFDMATGRITVDGDFSPALDATSTYRLIYRIPIEVKYAAMEQALYISGGGGERARLQAEGVKSYSIGDLSETFGDGQGGGATAYLTPEAKGFLKGFISKIGRIIA